jgi:hypothetical protein
MNKEEIEKGLTELKPSAFIGCDFNLLGVKVIKPYVIGGIFACKLEYTTEEDYNTYRTNLSYIIEIDDIESRRFETAHKAAEYLYNLDVEFTENFIKNTQGVK